MSSHTIAHYHILSHIIACYPFLFITCYHILSSVLTYCHILPHITTHHRIFYITMFCHIIITYYYIIITYDHMLSHVITYDHILSHIITCSQRQPYKNIRISKLNVSAQGGKMSSKAFLQKRIVPGFGWLLCWLVPRVFKCSSFQVLKFPSLSQTDDQPKPGTQASISQEIGC